MSVALAALALSPIAFGVDANAADLRGVWLPASSGLLKTTAGNSPPLRPELRERYERNLRALQSGDLSFDNTKTMCQSPGVPRAFFISPLRILQKSDFVMFVLQWNYAHVLVPILSTHTEDDGDVFLFGESIGRWEGDVFIMDTVRSSDETLLDSALPHSEALHVTSRFRLGANGKVLVADISIDDPESFTSPWDTRLEFHRAPPGMELKQDVCSDRESIPVSQDSRLTIPSPQPRQ